MRYIYILACSIFIGLQLHAQEHFPKNEPQDSDQGFYALTNTTVVNPDQLIEKATVVIRNGKIVSVKKNGAIPKGAIEKPLNGQFIYPSFIDLHSDFGQRKINIRTSLGDRSGQQFVSKKKGYYWNEQIQPQNSAYQKFKFDAKKAKEKHSAGFGYVLSQSPNGMARGTGMLVALQDKKSEWNVVKKEASTHFSMNKTPSAINYPTSLIGKLALFRQFFADVEWYKKATPATRDYSIEAYINQEKLPHFIEVNNKRDVNRVTAINKEFIVKSTLDVYEGLDYINTNTKLIQPINFPKAYDVQNPYEAMNLSLREMRDWNQAPKGLTWLKEKGITFSLTQEGSKTSKDWWTNLRKAINYGLNEKDALTSLTKIPAQWMGLEKELGSVEAGKWASFFIANGNMFTDSKANVTQHWVQGIPHKISDYSPLPSGEYDLKIGAETYTVKLTNTKGKITAKSDSAKVKFNLTNDWLNMSIDPKGEKNYRLSGNKSTKGFKGFAWNHKNNKTPFTLTHKATKDAVKSSKKKKTQRAVLPLTYPNTAYGFDKKPEPKNIVLRNATLWTNEKEGTIKNADIWIKAGKIKAIGQNVSARGAEELDATGMHITPGIVDEHSHIIIERGVNEWGQNNSAEVRIGDALDNEDINILRQLSGGVTTSQLLHGSANPIGGQSQIVKLKWGYSPEEMKFPDAPKFIKFALGENVKQSNWNLENPTRYPQTRMGVEQHFYESFLRAREYDADKNPNKRRDYTLETLAEILNGERNISCHSYVQSEIKMLMSVADSLNFKINTFTHILEGYKVADEMAKHGAAGSTFSDWWAYKFEVNDAIPQNAGIMHRAGVLTAINSDDAEMARRLNQEAAKSIKYSGISEEDALKFVTLNPAKMLHIDDRVGSLKVGKDADIVVWNKNPLSQYAKAQKTFVDGALLYDRSKQKEWQEKIRNERNQLIQMMLNSDGKKKQVVDKKTPELYTCESLHH